MIKTILISLIFSSCFNIPGLQVGLPIPITVLSIAYHIKFRPSQFKYGGIQVHNYFAILS